MLAIDRLKGSERLTMVAPLGLRFWDEVSARVIGDGLNVTAYPADNPARCLPANLPGIAICSPPSPVS